MTEWSVAKRVTCKRRRPNQVIIDILESLYRDALNVHELRKSFVPNLRRAISSLEKCPLELSSGAECAILKGFDSKLCRYIDFHLNRTLAGNKKTKASDNGLIINGECENLKTSAEEITDVELIVTSKKNRKKQNNRNFETNIEICTYPSQSGESSHTKADSNDSLSINLTHCPSKAVKQKSLGWKKPEKNNNSSAYLEVEDSKFLKNKTPARNSSKVRKLEKNNNTASRVPEEENSNTVRNKTSAWRAFRTQKTEITKITSTSSEVAEYSKPLVLDKSFVDISIKHSDNTRSKQIQNKKVNNPNDDRVEQLAKSLVEEPYYVSRITYGFDFSHTEYILDDDDEECSNPMVLETYFVNRSKQDSENRQSDDELQNNTQFNYPKNWESLSKAETEPKKKSAVKLPNLCEKIVVLDDSDDDCAVTEIKAASDETPPNNQCLHNKHKASCKQCETVSVAANTFQLYFKEKSKKDAEEIEKCIVPRNLYRPVYRSGAYAILLALLEQRNECPYRDCLTKEELIKKAQKHTEQSFTKPDIVSSYTAWMNAKRLVAKGMIQITNIDNNSEDYYTLTSMGRAIAMELVADYIPKVTVNDVIFHGQRNDRVPSLEDMVLVPPPPSVSVEEEPSSMFIEMPPGTFDIVMLIDKREHFDKTLPASPNNYCKYESRSLTIGDFVWVARSKKTGHELVLPYIIERKRVDDLASSIKDGRFHEQKFRLRKCGLRNVIYLVESHKMNGQYGLPVSTLMQAIVNTSVLDEFRIVKTDSLNHTFKFLGMLSERMVHDYLPVFLRGCNSDTQGKELMTFEFFNAFSSKNKPLTVRDTFIKMLLQLKGLSIEKALAITHKYSTPRLLMKAYDKCTAKEGELLLANLKLNAYSRNVGPAISKTVYKLFSKQT